MEKTDKPILRKIKIDNSVLTVTIKSKKPILRSDLLVIAYNEIAELWLKSNPL